MTFRKLMPSFAKSTALLLALSPTGRAEADLPAASQQSPARSSNARSGSEIIPLYPKNALKPLSVPEIRETPEKNGGLNIRNVSTPTLELFRPRSDAANGTGIIVVPGGGFMNLVYDNEGTVVARRLADMGYTAFVLKYRLVQTPPALADMQAKMMKDMGGVLIRSRTGTPTELPRFPGEALAQQDAAQAMRVVRGSAARWGIRSDHIGMLGFSAGAFVAADLAIGPRDTRPDFVGLLYGGLRTPVPKDAPPAFIATAADDPMLPNDPILLFEAWRSASRPAELHVYEKGGHGFGAGAVGTSSDIWIDEFLSWMKSNSA